MARVERLTDALESLALEDTDAGARVVIAPARGGLVTRFSIDGREVLYLDEATLRDPAKNVRGGIPVLFPTPGKLEGDRWEHCGKSGSLRQHGFARNLAWEVRNGTLVLSSSDATRELWPWSFAVEHRFSLRGSTLRIGQHVENRSDEPMPFGSGFHPYFRVPSADKAAVRVDTPATRAWDNVARREIELRGIDLGAGEVDLHLLDHGRSDGALLRADGSRLVQIECSPEYQRWVVWTLPGKDFVCLEPWTTPANALNDGVGLLELAPGESRELHVAITA